MGGSSKCSSITSNFCYFRKDGYWRIVNQMLWLKTGLIMNKKADIDVLDAVIADEVKDAW